MVNQKSLLKFKMQTNPFEGSQEKIRPNISALIKELAEYNNAAFDWEMSKELIDTKADGGIETAGEQDEEKWRQAKLADLKRKYNNVFDNTGLSVEAVKMGRDFANEANDEEQVQPTEMSLNVSDSKKFLSYLHFLLEQGLSEDERISLDAIAAILTQQFTEQYDVSNGEDDRFLNLIGSLKEIIDLYVELGLENSVTTLKKLLMIARDKYLKEYLFIKRMQYFLPNTKPFSPAQWHNSMGIEEYEKKWDEAIEIYHEIMSNPKAKDLFDSLRRHFSQAVDMAIGDIHEKEKKYKKDAYREYLKKLIIVKKRL